MQWKDAIANMHKEHSDDNLIPLYTTWGEQMIQDKNTEDVWQEYPRPQLRREDYHMLNGVWEYKIEPLPHAAHSPAKPSERTFTGENAASKGSTIPGSPFTPDGSILVPFSPEALLSGVNRQLKPEEYLWYQRTVHFSREELSWRAAGKRCLLHFDAVDQQAEVYGNGKLLASHSGGYLPFSADITEAIGDTPLLLQVRVRDESDTGYHSRGKQTLKRGGMFYTAQSGIWQSVWYEWVPENYIMDCRITPDYDRALVVVELTSRNAFTTVHCKVCEAACYDDCYARNDVTVAYTGAHTLIHNHHNSAETKTINPNMVPPSGIINMQVNTNADPTAAPCRTTITLTFPDQSFQAWSPEAPFLYPLIIEADEEQVASYFAMRCFTVEPDEKGVMRFHLNHKPYFLHGLLDQGYWSDGLMTAPCDEALIFDIQLAKDCGFNMLRKHIKIEPLRWYYHCDRLGMIVWQDMVNGGTSYNMLWVCYLPTVLTHLASHTVDRYYRLFSRISEEGRKAWEQECVDTVKHLYNVPSLAVWVPFNEGWGQFDAARIAALIKEKDPTRPVDHASGWFDQNAGDFRSVHNYFRPLKVKLDEKRAFVISEYGGYACHVEGHSSVERIFGYKRYDTCEELSAAYRDLIEKQVFPLEEQGLSSAVYTQLSDIEEEVNGLVTYDRKVVKLQPLT